MSTDQPARHRWPALTPTRWTVRARSTVSSMVIVGLALVAVFAAVLFTLKASLESSTGAAARDRAEQVSVALAAAGPAALDQGLFADASSAVVVQVLDSTGAVLRASAAAPPQVLTAQRPSPGQQLDVGLVEVPRASADYWVVARDVPASAGSYLVLTGAFQGPVESTVWTVFVAFLLAWPFTVALAGWATFVLVGRAFRPVDQITATVSRISQQGRTDQVPVPPTRDEIARLATTMNHMLARLDAGLQAQRQFVGDASHELRSPLAGIIAALELGVRSPRTLDPHTVESALLPEARRMQALIDDLLLLATADEQGLRAQVADVDFDDVVQTAARAAQLATASSSLRLTVQTVPVRLTGDANQLNRLVRNLIDNAARFAKVDIEVSLADANDEAILTVADDGPGIPVADRRRVFDRFVRLDQDRSRARGGTGLGLAIVAEVVSAHGGTVTVGESAKGGALVTVRLPHQPAPTDSHVHER